MKFAIFGGVLLVGTLLLAHAHPNHPPNLTFSPKPVAPQVSDSPDVCQPGYAKSKRPTKEYTDAIKRHKVWEQGGKKSDYQLDHIVPLSLGGTNDESNLRLEPINQAKDDDKIELELHTKVCRGEITLTQAQQLIREAKNSQFRNR